MLGWLRPKKTVPKDSNGLPFHRLLRTLLSGGAFYPKTLERAQTKKWTVKKQSLFWSE